MNIQYVAFCLMYPNEVQHYYLFKETKYIGKQRIGVGKTKEIARTRKGTEEVTNRSRTLKYRALQECTDDNANDI